MLVRNGLSSPKISQYPTKRERVSKALENLFQQRYYNIPKEQRTPEKEYANEVLALPYRNG
jgi:hypothetical protein